MFRTSPTLIAVLSIAPLACPAPKAEGDGPQTTGEASSEGPAPTTESPAPTTEGPAPTTTVGTSLPGTSDTSTGDTTQVDTGNGDTTQPDPSGTTTEGTTTGDSTTGGSTDTGGEIPLKVGLALKSLCSPHFDVMCGTTLDDRMVCWGDVDHPSFQVPPGKVKSVSDHCFIAVLENGDLHRVLNYPLKPVTLPKGPFVLAGSDYPYGCAMAANNAMTCWVAEGFKAIDQPPPGPYLALGDAYDGICQMCGIKGDGSLVCWKKPLGGDGDWAALCGGDDWAGVEAGPYTKLINTGMDFVTAMNSAGQFVWFMPNGGGSTYVEPLFAPGGFVEANGLVGLKDSGELLHFEKGMGDGVPLLPGAYVTFEGTQYNGCAIRQADSRVVCWGEGASGQFDPPTE